MNTPTGGNHLVGFEYATAAVSLCLSEKYKKCLRIIENELNVVTSTPKHIMDVSFTKCFRETTIQSVDNDSGYVSTNPESTMDFNCVNMSGSCSYSQTKPIYLCEDALLEKPEIRQQQQEEKEEEYDHLFFLTDSVVVASCESEKTNFSGLEEAESGVEKDASSESLVIPLVTPIVANTNKTACDVNSKIMNYPSVKTPEKSYTNPITSDISPDLFSDEDEPCKTVETNQCFTEKYIHPNDQKLIKRVQEGLSGVFPPPSVTFFCMSVTEMLEKINNNKHLFVDKSIINEESEKKSLLITESSKDAIQMWPQVLEQRYHGLL